jgi:hypothetical protein
MENNMNPFVLTLPEIRQLCIDYDKTYGEWPENKFEGENVLEHIYKKLGLVWSYEEYQKQLYEVKTEQTR